MQRYVTFALAVVVGFVGGQVIDTPLRGAGATPVPALDGQLSHLSFAVNDAEHTAQAFADVFGIEEVQGPQEFHDIPWGPRFPGKVMHTRRTGMTINGVTFEFLQPLEGESPWQDFIDRSGEGVQHIGFSVPDVQAAVDYLESKGGIQTQEYMGFASYVDMTDAGLPITFEVARSGGPGQ